MVGLQLLFLFDIFLDVINWSNSIEMYKCQPRIVLLTWLWVINLSTMCHPYDVVL